MNTHKHTIRLIITAAALIFVGLLAYKYMSSAKDNEVSIQRATTMSAGQVKIQRPTTTSDNHVVIQEINDMFEGRI